MERMLHAPVNLFFDTNSSGKILTRFTKDLDYVGSHLPNTFKWCLRNICVILITICYVAYNAPWCLSVLPVALTLFYFTCKDFIRTSIKISKVEKMASSPITTHINESIEGVTTINTFKKAKQFEDMLLNHQDNLQSAEILSRGLN